MNQRHWIKNCGVLKTKRNFTTDHTLVHYTINRNKEEHMKTLMLIMNEEAKHNKKIEEMMSMIQNEGFSKVRTMEFFYNEFPRTNR